MNTLPVDKNGLIQPTEDVVLLTKMYRESLPFLRLCSLPCPRPEAVFSYYTPGQLFALFNLMFESFNEVNGNQPKAFIFDPEIVYVSEVLKLAAATSQQDFVDVCLALLDKKSMSGGAMNNTKRTLFENLFNTQVGGNPPNSQLVGQAAILPQGQVVSAERRNRALAKVQEKKGKLFDILVEEEAIRLGLERIRKELGPAGDKDSTLIKNLFKNHMDKIVKEAIKIAKAGRQVPLAFVEAAQEDFIEKVEEKYGPLNTISTVGQGVNAALLLGGLASIVGSYTLFSYATGSSIRVFKPVPVQYKYELPALPEGRFYKLKPGVKALWKEGTVTLKPKPAAISNTNKNILARVSGYVEAPAAAALPAPPTTWSFWPTWTKAALAPPPLPQLGAPDNTMQVSIALQENLKKLQAVNVANVKELPSNATLINPPEHFEEFSSCPIGYQFNTIQQQCLTVANTPDGYIYDPNLERFVPNLNISGVGHCLDPTTYFGTTGVSTTGAAALSGLYLGGPLGAAIAGTTVGIGALGRPVYSCLPPLSESLKVGVGNISTRAGEVLGGVALAFIAGALLLSLGTRLGARVMAKSKASKMKQDWEKKVIKPMEDCLETLIIRELQGDLLKQTTSIIESLDDIRMTEQFISYGLIDTKIANEYITFLESIEKRTNLKNDKKKALKKEKLDAFIEAGILAPFINKWYSAKIEALQASTQYKQEDPAFILASILAREISKDPKIFKISKELLSGSDSEIYEGRDPLNIGKNVLQVLKGSTNIFAAQATSSVPRALPVSGVAMIATDQMGDPSTQFRALPASAPAPVRVPSILPSANTSRPLAIANASSSTALVPRGGRRRFNKTHSKKRRASKGKGRGITRRR